MSTGTVVDLDRIKADLTAAGIESFFDYKQTALNIAPLNDDSGQHHARVREDGKVWLYGKVDWQLLDIIRPHVAPVAAPDELRAVIREAIVVAAMQYPPDAEVTCFNLDRAVDVVIAALEGRG